MITWNFSPNLFFLEFEDSVSYLFSHWVTSDFCKLIINFALSFLLIGRDKSNVFLLHVYLRSSLVRIFIIKTVPTSYRVSTCSS